MADKKAGRPTKYNQKTAANICAQMASGKSLRSICKSPNLPAASTVFLWLTKHKDFSEQYATAQADRTVFWAEEIVEIADDDAADTQRSRLRVDTRKWLMSKMSPKKYGDKSSHELTGRGGGPIQTVDLTNLSEDQLATLETIIGPLAIASGDDDEGDTSGTGA